MEVGRQCRSDCSLRLHVRNGLGRYRGGPRYEVPPGDDRVTVRVTRLTGSPVHMFGR